MPIYYSLLACQHIPLADYSPYTGTYRKFIQDFFKHFDPRTPRATYKVRQLCIHCLSISEIFYFVCITDKSFPQAHAFSYLTELDIQFQSDYGPQMNAYLTHRSAPLRYEMNQSLQSFLAHTLNRYNQTTSTEEELLSVVDGSHATQEIKNIDFDDTRIIRRVKTPFLVHSINDIKLGNFGASKFGLKSNSGVLASWLLNHPYLTIGFCLFVGIAILIYFVVVVPLCGPNFQKTDANGKLVCWFSPSEL